MKGGAFAHANASKKSEIHSPKPIIVIAFRPGETWVYVLGVRGLEGSVEKGLRIEGSRASSLVFCLLRPGDYRVALSLNAPWKFSQRPWKAQELISIPRIGAPEVWTSPCNLESTILRNLV